MKGLEEDPWEEMTPAERIVRCRHKAREAEQFAQTAPVDYKPLFKEIAERWLRLAAELEVEPS